MYKVIFLTLVAFAVGLKKFEPIKLVPVRETKLFKASDGPCQDGVNNVIELADTGDYNIQTEGLTIQTYDAEFNPSCSNGRAKISLPGIITLAKGKIIVRQASDLEHMRQLLLYYTLKGNVGDICVNGHPRGPLRAAARNPCRYDISPVGKKLPLGFYQMLSKPGTYDLEEIAEAGGIATIIPMDYFPQAYVSVQNT
ncbi:unnamed protein product [Cylicostephanus goldi]|uniref:Uncharacterized protein n=1 Tax=Cylicostephanus goldi TaxID=71465 RepID=A0A3P6R202_CYLGO|nr:unnamed protein product [Cylicostephanus goldi]